MKSKSTDEVYTVLSIINYKESIIALGSVNELPAEAKAMLYVIKGFKKDAARAKLDGTPYGPLANSIKTAFSAYYVEGLLQNGAQINDKLIQTAIDLATRSFEASPKNRRKKN